LAIFDSYVISNENLEAGERARTSPVSMCVCVCVCVSVNVCLGGERGRPGKVVSKGLPMHAAVEHIITTQCPYEVGGTAANCEGLGERGEGINKTFVTNSTLLVN